MILIFQDLQLLSTKNSFVSRKHVNERHFLKKSQVFVLDGRNTHTQICDSFLLSENNRNERVASTKRTFFCSCSWPRCQCQSIRSQEQKIVSILSYPQQGQIFSKQFRDKLSIFYLDSQKKATSWPLFARSGSLPQAYRP